MASPKKKVNLTPPATPQHFPVVGVGASAGGLDAFKRLLETIPENSGMAYVLVQHLSPTHESILPEILQRVTKLPVHEINDNIRLAPNHIYVIPSAKILTAIDGVLSLSPRENFETHLPIDIFFKSLAEVHKELAAGVVLSGTGNDGTLGLKAIEEHGGITMAQDVQSAEYADMPKNAVDAGVVNFTLPPEEIPAQLLQIFNNYPKVNDDGKEKPFPKDDEAAFKQILSLLHQRSGIDFTYYKQNTIRRRIARRMGMRKNEKLDSYLKFLRGDKAEQDALFRDMLIPVTSFFRDPKTFDTLCNKIFPLLFKNRTPDETIRIWIAGCSTGEEAYSIAICLHEFLGEKAVSIPIQIFASDISEIAIKKARIGIYPKANVQVLSDERLKKYFRKTDGSFEVKKVIRDMCVFAPHNFLKDPPFAKMDLVSCRNVLIYMDNFLQKKALAAFHYSLNPNGFLLLGKSETVSAAADMFTQYSKHDKIYSRKPVPGRFMYVNSERKGETVATQTLSAGQAGKTSHLPEALQTDFKKSGEALLLSKYTPTAVIINEQMDIVHIHGSITPFLEPSPGKPTFNLLKMAREGLGFELRNAFHKAKTTNGPVIKEGIPAKQNGSQHLVTIEMVPLANTVEPHYLILFSKTELPSAIPLKSEGVKSKQTEEAKQRVSQLEKELSQAREDMRSISEEQEAANEELQSANEELQSSNEEMQTLNEELETSKEELQSSNEELTIVNQELLDKQEQLNDARLYSESIIATIRHPLVVLDKSLHIKTANASFYKLFNTTEEATEGKLFYEIQNNQWDDIEIRSLLKKILTQKEQLTDFEIILKFPLLGERTMLLNGLQIVNEPNRENLILLAIEDVTDIRLKEHLLHESENKFRYLSQTIPHMIWMASPDGKYNYFNQYMLDYTGKTFDELSGDGWQKIISPLDRESTLKQWKHSIDTGEDYKIENRLRHHDGNYHWHSSHAIAQKDKKGNINLWLGTNTNTDEQKIREEQKDEFISIASHEMKTPLTTAKGYLELLLLSISEKNETAVYALRANHAVERLNSLVKDLLDSSKIQNGKLNYYKTTFDFNAMVDETIETFQHTATNHILQKTGSSSHQITGDKDRLQQVLINLIDNAIKYSPTADKIIIKIEEQDDKIKLSVQDFGCGISSQHLDKIFDRYYRVQEHAAHFQGLGVGLYISNNIIQSHEGKIWVESEPEKGSTFYFTLPL